MKSANYTRKHHMYLMNHKNGDVIEVRMDKRNKTFKKYGFIVKMVWAITI